MWLLIILAVILVVLTIYAAISIPKSPYDQELEDKDQIRWLQQHENQKS